MEIKLSMEILQVAMTIDEARQNALASDINDLSAGRNRDFSAITDRLEPACLYNDDGILNRRPPCAIDQFSTLHNECFFCHVSFLPRPARHQHQSASRFDFHLPGENLLVGPSAPGDVACRAVEIRKIIERDERHILHENF